MKSHKLGYKLYWSIIKLSRSNKVIKLIIDLAALVFYKIFRRDKYFIFQEEKYKYFYHFYNQTVAGERIVEIPIVRKLVEAYSGKNILEVGNVLGHYFSINHDVIDKYEKAPGVINEDVASFKFKKKYDLIISVSTMEHVGFSYGEKKEPGKFLKATENLKRHLDRNGKLFVTLPFFYNPFITRLIKEKKMPFNQEYFLKRVSFLNEWIEVDFEEAVKGSDYDGYYANTNVLYLGVFDQARK